MLDYHKLVSHKQTMKTISFSNTPTKLRGECIIPGDKSISHRSLILGSQTLGQVTISGLLESQDVLCTLACLQQLGVKIEKKDQNWHVTGQGVGGLQESNDILDCGNSGTSARLLMGLVAPYEFTSFFTGDVSLRKRPMARVINPLSEMGVTFTSRSQDRLPVALKGGALMPIEYHSPIASAQVKSAILLAGLNTPGITSVIEPAASRDHSEIMLNALGWQCETQQLEEGACKISITGQQQVAYEDRQITVPADPSSAAFPIAAALLSDEADVTLPTIGLNPLRTGLFTCLQEMGARLKIHNERLENGEKIGDLHIQHSPELKAIDVPAERAPSMIDEYPILAVIAAFSEGTSRFRGLKELRVKESDRLTAMAEGLQQCGIHAVIEEDDLIIEGIGQQYARGGCIIDSQHDHRIAMSFLIMGMRCEIPVNVTGTEAIDTSFPSFFDCMKQLGITIHYHDLSKHKPLTIAIDGPAASGKGTLARRLAEALGLKYLDTGSLYRAVGMKLLYSNQSPEDEQAALEAAQSITLQDLRNPRLRQEHVGNAASIISAMPAVREALLNFQREIAASPEGAVLDGRDIGTVVCPQADYKFFITADIETRAKRRHRELSGQGIEVVYDSVLADLKERDERDSQRDAAPLKPAEQAETLDTSSLSADEVLERVLALIRHHT